MTLTPSARYQQDLAQHRLQPDSAQTTAVNALQTRYEQLQQPALSWWQKLLGRRAPLTPGLYMWGGVGRGKTYLMDIFYESLSGLPRLRMHFYHLMQLVHQRLEQQKGHEDPLQRVAEQLAQECRVLCLDEFYVSDIADAMLLGGLLQGLFERGVTLVATSNIPPEELYKNGLQRARFLPAIDALTRYTEILNVDGGVDYRQRALTAAQCFLTSVDAQTDTQLDRLFTELATDRGEEDKVINVLGRSIVARRESPGVVCFDFAQLCQGPRSQLDYIELARSYHTVLIRGVMQMGVTTEDVARRWLMLVDEFYDRRVKLICSAAVDVDALYQGEFLRFEFDRCLSRLHEMQSAEYLQEPHRPE